MDDSETWRLRTSTVTNFGMFQWIQYFHSHLCYSQSEFAETRFQLVLKCQLAFRYILFLNVRISHCLPQESIIGNRSHFGCNLIPSSSGVDDDEDANNQVMVLMNYRLPYINACFSSNYFHLMSFFSTS